MVCIGPMVIGMDSYGPIVDNAGGIIEMSKLGKKAERICDRLDSAGNTTKSVCKGFAIGAAALAALALFSAYIKETELVGIDLMKSPVFVGLFRSHGFLLFLFLPIKCCCRCCL
jgi:K(+)-stimulated pyrophosphate-energized sodium pump